MTDAPYAYAAEVEPAWVTRTRAGMATPAPAPAEVAPYTPSAETIAYAHEHSPRDYVVSVSVIAGQPRSTFRVHAIMTVGDVLYYTTDGVWYSTATRSDIADWEYAPEAEACPVSYRGQDCAVTGAHTRHTSAARIVEHDGHVAPEVTSWSYSDAVTRSFSNVEHYGHMRHSGIAYTVTYGYPDAPDEVHHMRIARDADGAGWTLYTLASPHGRVDESSAFPRLSIHPDVIARIIAEPDAIVSGAPTLAFLSMFYAAPRTLSTVSS